MELITLCGLLVVAIGVWVEFGAAMKAVVRLAGRVPARVTALFQEEKQVCANRYVLYPR